MARQTIDLGTSPNRGDGDPLRTAFDKVNDNFAELYAGNFAAPDATGSSVIPDTDATYDLGSADKQWADLYVKDFIYLNGARLETDANGNLRLNGAVIAADSQGSVFGDDSTLLVDGVNNAINLDGTVSGDIIPDTDVAYDLGSASKRFRDIYLSGSTINLGGLEINNVGGELQLDGVKIPTQTDLNLAADTGDITFTDSTISAADDTDITIQTLDEDSALRSRISLSPDVGAVSMRGYSRESSDTFNTSDWDTATWTTNGGGGVVTIVNAAAINDFINNELGSATGITFSINGGTAESLGSRSYSGLSQTLTLNTANAPDPDPTTVTEIEFFYSFSSRIGIDYDDGSVSMSARGSMNVSINSEQDINLSADDDIQIEGADTFNLINTSTTAPIQIITDDTNNSYTWEFKANGGLTFPDATVQTTAYPGPQTSFDGDLTIAGNIEVDGSFINNSVSDGSGLQVETDSDFEIKVDTAIWSFEPNDGGRIQFPDGSTQTTAYTGPQTSFTGDISIGEVSSGQTDIYGNVEFNNGTTAFQSGNSVDFNTDVDFNSEVKFAKTTTTGGATALDVTKTLQVLNSTDGDDDSWTLADGTEGQIMHFVPGSGTGSNQHYIEIANWRRWDSDTSSWIVEQDLTWTPFRMDFDGTGWTGVATAIFTNGAWQTSNPWVD